MRIHKKKGLFIILFNSYIFVLGFLPVTLFIYYLFNSKKQYMFGKVWLIAMSLVFYGYFNVKYLPIIVFSILINYCLSRYANAHISQSSYSIKIKCVIYFGVFLNIASIFYFKYYDFFISCVNRVFGSNFILLNLVLPLGISFFTFQQISYLIDTLRGETASYSFIDYALFVLFFPQLVAGPIVLHKEMIPQFEDVNKKVFDNDSFSHGLFVFAVGLFKKMLVADSFGLVVTWGYDIATGLTTLEFIIVSLCYTMQIYFDFSGYCDMAVGIGKMFNISLPLNFNSPYKATSIAEFWKRWHMTLTRFLTQYVYIPLGGNQKGMVRTLINIMLVFLISGIWHGASFNFIVWGILHGLCQVFHRLIQKYWSKLWVGIRWLLTFLFINFTWVIFRVDGLSKAFSYIKSLFVYNNESFVVRPALYESFNITELSVIRNLFMLPLSANLILLIISLILAIVVCVFTPKTLDYHFKTNTKYAVVTILLLVMSVMSMSGITTFLYFNF